MKLIVGLGNPGPQYALTRHNIGFMAIDVLAENFGGGRQFKNEFKSEIQKISIDSEKVILCKPQTFMNRSGEAVQAIVQMFKIEHQNILVMHDEIDIPFGKMRFQSKRGAGGHNGIRSVHQMLGGDDYGRLRLGVGRPPSFVDDDGNRTRPTIDVGDYVLQKFSKEEFDTLPDFLKRTCEAVEVWLKQGLQVAANKFNG